jgi:endonuclease YncB( thermonuclease family)
MRLLKYFIIVLGFIFGKVLMILLGVILIFKRNTFVITLLLPTILLSQDVIDGDTFKYKGNYYRMAYIDAPEKDQPIVGELSKKYLEKIIDVSNMKVISTDKYGRYIVVLGDINYRMVKEGYAIVYRFYCNKESYIKSEALARKNKLGIHKYNFKNPSDWRKEN